MQGHGTRKQGKYTCTQRALSTSGFVNVDCVLVAGFVCVNMHNEQNRSRAGGLFVDPPRYGLCNTSGLATAARQTVPVAQLTTVVAS